MKFSIKDFLNKCDQFRSFLRIWSHLPKIFLVNVTKSLTENFFTAYSAVGANNTNGNPNNVIFIIKYTKTYVPVVTLSEKDNQKL